MYTRACAKSVALCLPFFLSFFSTLSFSMDIQEEVPPFISHYKQSLPSIKGGEDPAQAVGQLLLDLKIPTKEPMGEICDWTPLKEKIHLHMKTEQPLPLLMTGFPGKSTNMETKVISDCVDLAEYLALLTLDHLTREIKKVYAPGARITIISDGVVYAKALLMKDTTHQRYGCDVLRLANHLGLSLKLLTLKDFQDTPTANMPPEEQRTYLLSAPFGVKEESPEVLKGKKIFASEEFKCSTWEQHFENRARSELVSTSPKNQLSIKKNEFKRVQTQELLTAITIGSQQFGTYVSTYYPGYEEVIRLSVHPYGDVNYKLGIQLVYKSQGTPWHKAPVVTSHGVSLQYRKSIPKHAERKIFKVGDLELAYYEQ